MKAISQTELEYWIDVYAKIWESCGDNDFGSHIVRRFKKEIKHRYREYDVETEVRVTCDAHDFIGIKNWDAANQIFCKKCGETRNI